MQRITKSIACSFIILTTSLFCTPQHANTNDLWKGDDYAKNSQSQQDSATDFMQGIQVKNITDILDVGCGDGKITASIAEAASQSSVIGIDISPSMIQAAKNAFQNRTNLSFEVQDAANIHFNKQFDLITSFTVMQWVLNQTQALEGFEKALKTGGKLCVQMPIGLPKAIEQALQITLAKEKWAPYFSNFTPPWRFYQLNEYQKLLINANLTPTRLAVVTKHEHFPSRETFHGFLKQWFPYLRTLPMEQKDVFLSDLLDTYLRILPPDDQGKVSFIVDRLEVEAIK